MGGGPFCVVLFCLAICKTNPQGKTCEEHVCKPMTMYTRPNPDPTGQHLQDKVQVTRGLDNNDLGGTVQQLLTLLRKRILQGRSRDLTAPTCPMDNMFQQGTRKGK